MHNLGADFRQALRTLRSQRRFTLPVVLSLALGIGVNCAVVSLIDGLLLRPLPYRDAARVQVIWEAAAGSLTDQNLVSHQDFYGWREQSRSFERIEGVFNTFHNLTGLDTPARIACAEVTPGLFELLGVRPMLGRTLLPEESAPGAPGAVVLSYGFWQQHLGGAAKVLGRTLTLDGRAYDVAGVMAPSFSFVQDADVWLPMAVDPAKPPFPAASRGLFVVGKLRPGVSPQQAGAEMRAINARLARQIPEDVGWSVNLVPLRETLAGDLRPALLVSLGSVAFVLLIACANVSNLLLVRTAGRRDELALRAALGAGRGRLVQQIVAESIVLALAGGALGLGLAAATLHALRIVGPAKVLLLRGVGVDLRLLLFTLALALLTGVSLGLLAGRRAMDHLPQNLQSAGRRTTGGSRLRRLQNSLVIAEVALALVLLAGAGLLLRSFEGLWRKSPGFDPEGVMLASISLPDWKYSTPAQHRAFFRELLPRVESLPGVVSAGITKALPLNDFSIMTSFQVENRPPSSQNEVLSANFRKVSPGFFRALRVPLVSGRVIEASDDENGRPVAVVSREMAKRYWPGGDPIGRRFRRGNRPWLTVIGVVGDVEDGLPGSPMGITFYVPFDQDPKGGISTVYLLVRASVPPLSVAPAVRRAVVAVDRDQPLDRVMTMAEWFQRSLANRRFSTLLLGMFAALGTILAAIGIYGVLSYAVGQRRQEIGIRMALGAEASSVVGLVLRQGMGVAAIGLGVGLVAALALSRLLAGLLVEVGPGDPITLLAVTLGIAAVAFVATYLPARRAAALDPTSAIQCSPRRT